MVEHVHVRESRLGVTSYGWGWSSRLARLVGRIHSADVSSRGRRCRTGFLKSSCQELNLGHHFLVCDCLSLELFSLSYVVGCSLVDISSYYMDKGDGFLVQHSWARGW
ncbi:hypothetical protein ACJBU6_10912 [Exserohilum turcicum]